MASESDDDVESYFDDLTIRHVQSRVAQNTDYYPFGSVLKRHLSPGSKQYRYGYQGQYAEEDTVTGWNSFELRMFDPVIARWLSPDPMGEFWSPYLAMGNNPVNLTDPTGGMTGDPPTISKKGPGLNTTMPDWQTIEASAGLHGMVLPTLTFTKGINIIDILYWGFLDADAAFTGNGDSLDDFLKGGYEFYNSGNFSGEPVYWVRKGEVYGSIIDPSKTLISFGKTGEVGFKKGHIPSSNWVTKDVLPFATELKELSNVAKRMNNTKSSAETIMKELSNAHHNISVESNKAEPDSVWRVFYIDRGNGIIRKDSAKVLN